MVAKWPVTNIPRKYPSTSPLLFLFWFWLFRMVSGCDFSSLCPNDQSRSRHWANTFLALAFHTSRSSAGRQLTSSICGDSSWNSKAIGEFQAYSQTFEDIICTSEENDNNGVLRQSGHVVASFKEAVHHLLASTNLIKSQCIKSDLEKFQYSDVQHAKMCKNECLQRWHMLQVPNLGIWIPTDSMLKAKIGFL